MYESPLFPSKEQQRKLFHQLELCRVFYNICLQEQIDYQKNHGKYMTYYDQLPSATKIKQNCEEYKNVHTEILRDVVKRVVLAIEAYLKKKKKGLNGGFPHFKSKKRFNSFTYIDAGNENGIAIVYENQDKEYKTERLLVTEESLKAKELLKIKNPPKIKRKAKAIDIVSGRKRLRIYNIGNVKIKIHREMLGKLKTITIKYKNGNWFAYFSRDEIKPILLEKTGKTIAGDLGLLRLLTLSDGEQIENPRFLIRAEEKLKRLQQSLSRKQEGSSNYKEALYYLARAHAHVANCRKDFINKLAHYLVINYDVIIMEDLSIKNMINGTCNKSIHDVGWGIFLRKLAEAAEKTDKEFYKVDPAYTSQDCSKCGFRDPVSKSLSDRIHHCNKCGFEADRDFNAAQNILKKGLELKNKLDKEKSEKQTKEKLEEAENKAGKSLRISSLIEEKTAEKAII